jgi:hypothetical protein
VFYETINTTEENIRGASRLLQGEVKNVTPSTLALARTYLDAVYNPRHVPVPMKYYDLPKVLLNPWGWFNSREEESRRK